MALTSPFTKTLYIDLPPLPLWSSPSELSEVLPPGQQYSFCPSSVQSLSRVPLFATHGLQHARLPCPSPTPRGSSIKCPLSWWCYPTISSCLQACPASGSFPMKPFFASGGWSIGVSASARRKQKRTIEPLDETVREEWKSWLKTQHSET